MEIPATASTPRSPRTARYKQRALGSVLVVAPACLLFFCTQQATVRSSGRR